MTSQELIEAPAKPTLTVAARPNIFMPATHFEAVPEGQTLAELAAPYSSIVSTGARLVCYHNAHPVPEEWWPFVTPRAGTYVSFHAVPTKRGGPLHILGTIAVTVAAIAATAITGNPLIGLAVATVGNFALNSLTQPPHRRTHRLAAGRQERPHAITGQQNAFPRYEPVRSVKGNVRIYPPIVGFSQVVHGDDLDALNLYVVGLGRLALDSFHFGDTPIAEFDPGFQIEVREGTGSEADLTLFSNDIYEEEVQQQVDYGSPVTRSTREATDLISIDFLFPQGLYRTTSSGYATHSVDVQVEQTVKGQNNWSVVGAWTFQRNSRVPVRFNRNWWVPDGQYDVRVTRLSPDDNEQQMSLVNFQRIRSVDYIGNPVQKDWAVIAVRVSGDGSLPPFNCRAQSYLLDYDGTPGSWSVKVSRNPASVYRSILQDSGIANPVPNSRIDIEKLEEWHDFCATNNLFFDGVFEDEATVRSRLEQVATAGLATPTRGLDGRYSVVINQDPGPPVTMLGPANTRNFTGVIDHTPPNQALRVRYISREGNFTRWQEDEFLYYDTGYNKNNVDWGTVEVLDLTDSGVTYYGHAHKLARQFLAERKLRGGEKWNVDVGIESVRLARGQRVLWQHDVTLQGIKTSMIKSVTTDGSGNVTAITLEEEVEMEAGKSYGLKVMLTTNVGGSGQTAFVDKQASTVAGATNTLNFSGDPFPAATAPSKGDWAAFGIRGSETVDAIVQEIIPGPNLDETSFVLVKYDPAIYNLYGAIPSFDSNVTIAGDPNRVPPRTPVIEAARLVDVIDPREPINNIRTHLFIMLTQVSGATPQPQIIQGEIRLKDPIAGFVGSWERYILSGERGRFQFPEPIDRGFVYEIRLRAVSSQNVPSPWTTVLEVDARVPGDPGINAAKVTGLQIAGKPNATEVDTYNFKFVWRRNTQSFGPEITNDSTSGEGFLDAIFSHWIVEIFDTNGLRKRRQEEVITPSYTYQYSDNQDDSIRLDATANDPKPPPAREITVKVRVVDRYGRKGIPATLAVSNPAPPQPQNLQLDSAGTRLIVSAEDPELTDLRDLALWWKLGSDPAPGGDTTLLPNQPSGVLPVHMGSLDVPAGDLHIRAAFRDLFSPDPASLNVSPLRTKTISPSEVDVNLPEFSFDPPLVFTPNSPDANKISWNATTASVVTAGTGQSYSISSGSASWSSGTLYIYYSAGDNILKPTTDITTVFASVNNTKLASYRGGTDLASGEAYLHGSEILAQTVGANQIIATQAVITQQAQLASAVVTSAAIESLDADKLIAGSILTKNIYLAASTGKRIQLDGVNGAMRFFNTSGVEQLRLGHIGATEGYGFLLTNETGNQIVMRSDQVNGTYMEGAFIKDATIQSAKITDAAITNAKIDNLAVGTTKIQNEAATSGGGAENADTTWVDTNSANDVNDTFNVLNVFSVQVSGSRGVYVAFTVDLELYAEEVTGSLTTHELRITQQTPTIIQKVIDLRAIWGGDFTTYPYRHTISDSAVVFSSTGAYSFTMQLRIIGSGIDQYRVRTRDAEMYAISAYK